MSTNNLIDHKDISQFTNETPWPTDTQDVYEHYDEENEYYFGRYYDSRDVAYVALKSTLFLTRVIDEHFSDIFIHNELNIDAGLVDTVRSQLIEARVGQGRYRQSLLAYEKKCRITGVEEQKLLIASHMKPWSICETVEERLNGANGLLLTPTFDKLFDRGYMTFTDEGEPEWSNQISAEVLKQIGVPFEKFEQKQLHEDQKPFIEFHRKNVFKK